MVEGIVEVPCVLWLEMEVIGGDDIPWRTWLGGSLRETVEGILEDTSIARTGKG